MINRSRRKAKQQEKDKTRKRMHVEIDPENYSFTPAKKQTDYYDNNVKQYVGIYARVSTDDVRQTTSYELQKKYYEDFVVQHPNWELVEIYADEGISGTSLAKRDAFNKMIEDAMNGRLTMIITKNVARFARNMVDCMRIVRELQELKNPVGVFFESEAIFSLNDDSQMALSFQATMAEEESHTRSRSMETSLRMKLDHGIPLTPELLGYQHDADGTLQINPTEAPTVKLIFYMYLFGYTTQNIADILTALERKTYLGNVTWTSSGIVQILRNERHCGDVITRKTFTPNYRTHKSRKNRGDKPQSHYMRHHEGIVSRDDFIAVQSLLDNAKYKNKNFLPELRVIEEGMLKGFVTINPRWAGFTCADYVQACRSVYELIDENEEPQEEDITIKVEAGDFDMRDFEITRSEFFDSWQRPSISLNDNKIQFSTQCVRKFADKNTIELLVNPMERKLAIRPTNKDNRQGIVFSKCSYQKWYPKSISAAAFMETLYELFGWNNEYKYKIIGSLYEQDGEIAYIFNAANSEAYFKSYTVANEEGYEERVQPLSTSGKRVRAIPESWTKSFGTKFYLHEQTLVALQSQEEREWQLRLQGELFDTGKKLNVTSYDVLKSYIEEELKELTEEIRNVGTGE